MKSLICHLSLRRHVLPDVSPCHSFALPRYFLILTRHQRHCRAPPARDTLGATRYLFVSRHDVLNTRVPRTRQETSLPWRPLHKSWRSRLTWTSSSLYHLRFADITSSLTQDEIPIKLRCASCNRLTVNAFRLPCCDQNVCGSC